jgi:predicted transcriptional regulator
MATPVSVRLDEDVEREEKRQAFLQAGKDTWEHYQAAGQHFTGEEADAWLAQVEAGNSVDPLVCRV